MTGMHSRWRRAISCLLGSQAMGACAGPDPRPRAEPVLEVRLVGMRQIAGDAREGPSLVGGISGIDYDRASGIWLLASDDRGEHGPARFYRARMDIDPGDASSVAIVSMHAWTQFGGGPYAARGAGPALGLVADVEALRIDQLARSLWYASEGDREAGIPSFVRRAGMDGRYQSELPLPQSLQIQPDCACGGRSNLGPEGLSFTPDGQQLWVAMEAPLLQDGPVSGPAHAALTRFSLVDRAGRLVAQYAYRLDEAAPPVFASGASDNGVAEILAYGPRRLLVLERGGAQTGPRSFDFHVRLYDIDLTGATTVDPAGALDAASARPAAKRLLFDSAQLPTAWRDNYEAMAWGPVLADGRRSLVLASDNNFSGAPTRFLIFGVAGERH